MLLLLLLMSYFSLRNPQWNGTVRSTVGGHGGNENRHACEARYSSSTRPEFRVYAPGHRTAPVVSGGHTANGHARREDQMGGGEPLHGRWLSLHKPALPTLSSHSFSLRFVFKLNSVPPLRCTGTICFLRLPFVASVNNGGSYDIHIYSSNGRH